MDLILNIYILNNEIISKVNCGNKIPDLAVYEKISQYSIWIALIFFIGAILFDQKKTKQILIVFSLIPITAWGYVNFKVDYSDFIHDLESNNKKNFNLEKNIFLKKIKFFFDKIEYPVQIEELAKLNFDQLIDTICMISPFSIEEKQKLIEANQTEEKLL